jgi:glyoxylase-like metal-dependent hydrolase (beta-lactamase superfamily II)
MAIKITWYSHACFLIETQQAKVLIDPFITDNPLSPLKAHELETDYILVSHGHGDHLGDTVSIAKRTGATVIPGAASNSPSPSMDRACRMGLTAETRVAFCFTLRAKKSITPAIRASSMT